MADVNKDKKDKKKSEKELKGAANKFVDKLKDTASEGKEKIVDSYNDTKDFIEKNRAKVMAFLKSTAIGTLILFAMAFKFSALCYGCMSINVHGGLGGTNMNGAPYKPTKSSKGCSGMEESLKRPILEQIRESLSEFSFPYSNPLSCSNFTMFAEGFTGVRFIRWITETMASSYSIGRRYLNIVFSFFSNPDTAFWFFPLAIPGLIFAGMVYGPFSHSLFGILRSTELLPRNIFGSIALNPLSAFLTVNGFLFGLFALPVIAGGMQVLYLLSFLLFYPYIANDKFIFPGDKKRRAYSGLKFIRKNVFYRWRSLGFVWLAMLANNSYILAEPDHKEGRLIEIKESTIVVRYDTGQEVEVPKNDVSLHDIEYYYRAGYEPIHRHVYVNTSTYSQEGYLEDITINNEEWRFKVSIKDDHGKSIILNDLKWNQVKPSKKKKIDLKPNHRVEVINRGMGNLIPNTLWTVALIWLIWIQFPGYVKNIFNFLYYIIVYNQLLIAFVALCYYAMKYVYENRATIYSKAKDVAGDVAKKAKNKAKKAKDKAEKAKKQS